MSVFPKIPQKCVIKKQCRTFAIRLQKFEENKVAATAKSAVAAFNFIIGKALKYSWLRGGC